MARVVGSSMTECGDRVPPCMVPKPNHGTPQRHLKVDESSLAAGCAWASSQQPGPLASGGKKDFRGAFD